MLKHRAIEEKDYEYICKLAENKEVLFYMFPRAKYPLDIPQLKESLTRKFEPTVFFQNEQLIGYANLYYMEGESEPYIGHIIVAKQYRGQGYGKEILQIMLIKALTFSKSGCVKLGVFTDNRSAYELYRKFGFIDCGQSSRKDYLGNNRHIVYMKYENLFA